MIRSRRSILRACAKLIAVTTCVGLDASASPSIKWVAFYGSTAPEAVLAQYDLVVLDRMFEGSVAEVAQHGGRVCAYLSLGEIRQADPAFARVDRQALLEENAAWRGTSRIDVRHHQWGPLVIDEIIPSIVAKGFTGLLLDTLDTPAFLELSDPANNAGMTQASVNLVRAIRRAHPSMMLIANRGYSILSQIVDDIDAVLAESLLTRPDQGNPGSQTWNDATEIALQLSLLAPARERRRAVSILGLEYWDPSDLTSIKEIYATHRQLGHLPYVATRLLDRIIPEPMI